MIRSCTRFASVTLPYVIAPHRGAESVVAAPLRPSFARGLAAARDSSCPSESFRTRPFRFGDFGRFPSVKSYDVP